MKPIESEDRFSLVPCGLVASFLSRVPLIGRARRTRELWFFSAIAWLPLLVLAGLDGAASGNSVSLPLLFARQMSQVKERALTEFGQLGLDLAEQFRRKWVERRDTAESRMLDSADPSAVADYAAAYGAVSSMRVFPISMRGLIVVAGLLAVPFLPLVLLEFPMAAVLERLLNGIK